MTLLRTSLGHTLRDHRLRQHRTLRDVSGAARVSLGYLSEVERGQKEASSELLASICEALEVELADLLAEVSRDLRGADRSVRLHRLRPPAVPADDLTDELTHDLTADGADDRAHDEPADLVGERAEAPAADPALALLGPAQGASALSTRHPGEAVSLAA